MRKLKLPTGSQISRAAKSKIVGSTGIMMAGMGSRLVLQLLSFLIVSRFMGAAEFGTFVRVAALIAIISAFSGWGTGQPGAVPRQVAELDAVIGENGVDRV
jgi:O-antigen/teichoic acid export membrane protein